MISWRVIVSLELRNEEDYLITEDGARFWGTKVLLLQNDDI